MSARLGSGQFAALGTTVTVATTKPAALEAVLAVVSNEVSELDQAASRFRDDSELTMLNRSSGRPVEISPVLFVALQEALSAAMETEGILDPTVGQALERCGYDRDFCGVAPNGPPITIRFERVPGWKGIHLDPGRLTATIPAGVSVDLGATAKAGCADRSARRAAAVAECGVLVSMGGDIAVAGSPPSGGWTIRVADRHDAGAHEPGVTIAITSGGLATSGTAARRWHRGGQLMHHLIDPATGAPARSCWRTVTVAAESALSANIASSAAVILGPAAPDWLAGRHCHARLVAESGRVLGVGQWPTDALEPAIVDHLVERGPEPC
jgi:thiamine biosynthesis lipoprotein ApbE